MEMEKIRNIVCTTFHNYHPESEEKLVYRVTNGRGPKDLLKACFVKYSQTSLKLILAIWTF